MPFFSDVATGQQGEEMVQEYLTGLGYEVEDVRHIPEYQKKDIDFLIHLPPIFTISIEVKYDTQMARTGNIFVESVSNTNTGKAGWLHITQADYMIYVDSINKGFHIFKPDELRKHIEQHGSRYKYASAPDYKDGRVIKYSKGYCIPITELHNVGYYKTIQYNMEDNQQ